jgi:hypothetical protein
LLLDKKGDFQAATELLGRCLAIREKMSPDAWLTFHSRSALGGSLMHQKKLEDVERLLTSGYEGMQQRIGNIPAGSRHFVADSMQRLIDFYQLTGRPAEVTKWKKKLEDFAKSADNPVRQP